MGGLLRTEPATGIEAMQQINRVVLRTEFVASIFIIPIVSIGFAIDAFLTLQGPGRIFIGMAALMHLGSVLLVTIFGNVPMNNRLDSLDHKSNEAAAYWKVYGREWTRLNHLRTLGSILTAALYAIGAVIGTSSV